uniref:Uncharacterized protein n=1 Tax=Arundo donax TaxID=35708 RepID=A0A0A9HAR2_ARUDO
MQLFATRHECLITIIRNDFLYTTKAPFGTAVALFNMRLWENQLPVGAGLGILRQ